MSLPWLLVNSVVPFDGITSLGAAGFMGAMWLWERRTSQKREQQIDEAHARILGDRVAIDQLMDVIRQNAEAIARLCTTQEQLLRELNAGREDDKVTR